MKHCRARRKDKPSHHKESNELHRLEVIEEDLTHDRVRVQYIGYEGNEWRSRKEIVNLSISDSNCNSDSEGKELPLELQPVFCHDMVFPTCLNIYEQLAYKIKSSLVCSLKEDPACHINMLFDNIHFNGLTRKGIPVQGRAKSFTKNN